MENGQKAFKIFDNTLLKGCVGAEKDLLWDIYIYVYIHEYTKAKESYNDTEGREDRYW